MTEEKGEKKTFTLVSEQACYTFVYPELDRHGKPLEKINRITGIPDPQFKAFKMQNVQNIASKGYLCKATFNKDTPDILYESALEAHRNDPHLMLQEEYVRKINPKRAEAEEKLYAVTGELAAEKAKAAKAEADSKAFAEKLAEMQGKLEKLEKKSGGSKKTGK